MSIARGPGLPAIEKAVGQRPHTAPAVQGHAEPEVARNDFISVDMFCQIERDSGEARGKWKHLPSAGASC